MTLPERLGLRGRPLLAKCYLALLLVLAVRLTWRPYVGHDDFWAHAAVGRWIWQNGQVPSHTLFLWSASESWVAHSWLSELALFGLLTAGGESPEFYLLHALTGLLVVLPTLLLWRLWRGRAASLSVPAILSMLALWCSRDRFNPRGELVTILCFTVLVIFLIRWPGAADGEGPRYLSRREKIGALGVVLLFAAWANFHGGVALGLMLLGATCACDLLQARFRARAGALALLTLLCAAAVCVNPYGIRYWQVFRPVGGRMFESLVEWRPVWKSPLVPWPQLLAGAVVPALALLTSALNPRRRWSHVAWVLLTTGSYLLARRNVWPMFVAGLAVLAANARVLETERLWAALCRLLGRTGGGEDPAVPQEVHALGSLGVFLVWGGLMWASSFYVPQLAPDERPVPAGLADFIREKGPPGRAFNDYPYSGYFEWRFGGRLPLYIDLLNAYPEELHLEYGRIVRGTDGARELLGRRQIGYVVVASPNPEGPFLRSLAAYLDRDPRWVVVYADVDGALWVRRTPEYEYLWRLERPGAGGDR